MNKRGLSTLQIFLFLFLAVMIVILLGIYVYIFNTVTTSLDVDLEVGQVNLQDATQNTLGALNTALLQRIDLIGLSLLFGMVISMFANAYFLRDKHHILFILLDIILIVVAFILSVYLTQTYDMIINSTSVLSVYKDNLPLSSTFILNLPKIVGILGAVIMVLSYSKLPRQEESEIITGFDIQ